MKKLMILLLTFVLFFYSGNALSQPIVGHTAPALSGLKMITMGIPDTGNKFVFLDFWATYCAPEVASLPHLNSLAQRYKDKIVFLAVSDENEEQVSGFIQNKQWDNIYFGLDIDQIFHKNFFVKDLPVYYLISPKNIILSTGISYEITDHDLDSIIMQNDSTILKNTVRFITSPKSSDLITSVKILQKDYVSYFFKKADENSGLIMEEKDLYSNKTES
jgi:thiol-disulfide isomerase/thioredoxin